MTDEITPANHYAAAMDSVNLINGEKPDHVSAEEWGLVLKRNQDHLLVMLKKDFWTNEDLQPLRDAVEKSNAALQSE